MKCPKCRLDNPESAAFCENCASALGESAETEAYETVTMPPPDRDFTPGTLISGKYKLLEELGHGGMGSVFRAEQVAPIHREVALKIIKLGMDTARVVARFEAERQALAVMDHPNIATVYDAGATEKGRPFFVMELVHGIPVDDYCDKHKLTVRERLELFLGVCHAVQHAHQKGVIHRDLKPSNILVTVRDGKPVPKVIDFGISKATAQRLTERTLFTEQGQLIGTPEYMSPEQAEMSGLDVDTRTDIYSLGVMLYGLLVGRLPFEPKTLRAAGLSEIQRIIRDTDPPRPSTRVATLGDESKTVAAKMKTDSGALRKELRGDLDWIIMKSMEKDRTRRYATASEFATDIERHMRNEPVAAGPPSQVYRIKKYVKRHRLGVAAASFLTLSIIAGIIGTSVGLVKATRAERKARDEAQTADQVSEFLVDLFQVSDPGEARGNTITAREILEKGAAKIEDELSGQPLVQARLMETIGQVYQNLGLFNLAEPMLKKALEVCRKNLGENHVFTGSSMIGLAWLYIGLRRSSEAESLVRDGVRILEEATLPEEKYELARGLTMLGIIQRNKGELDSARDPLLRALEIIENSVGPDHERAAYPLYHLGWLYKLRGEFDEAEKYYQRALAIMERVLGPDHPNVLWCVNDLAVVAADKRDYEKSKTLYNRAISDGERILGPDHPFLSAALNNLGNLLWDLGEFAEAESCHRRALELREKIFGPDHTYVAGSLNNLGLIYMAEGKYRRAKESYTRALAIDEKASGGESLGVAEKLHNLAILESYLGAHESAKILFERALRIEEKTLGSEHPDVANMTANYARLLRMTKEFVMSVSLFERALKIHEKAYGPDSLAVGSCLMGLACVYAASGEKDKADEFYKRAVGVYEKAIGLDEKLTCIDQAGYWAVAGDTEAALKYIKRALELGLKRYVFGEPNFASLRGNKEFDALAAEARKRLSSSE